MRHSFLLIVFLSFLLTGCPSKPDTDSETGQDPTEEPGSTPKGETEYSAEFLQSKHHVSIERMEELRGNYNKKIAPVIKRAHPKQPDFVPTKYLWVELDELESYVHLLRKVEQINNHKISGVAINFGTNSDNDPRQHYGGRLTTFLNPTFAQNNSSKIEDQVQFFIATDQINGLEGEYKPIPNFNPQLKETDQGSLLFHFENNGTSLGFDEFGGVPPPW